MKRLFCFSFPCKTATRVEAEGPRPGLVENKTCRALMQRHRITGRNENHYLIRGSVCCLRSNVFVSR
ncbi:protein of unknown function [Nitratireductor aquimarinus]